MAKPKRLDPHDKIDLQENVASLKNKRGHPPRMGSA